MVTKSDNSDRFFKALLGNFSFSQVNSLLLDTRDEVYDFRDKFQSVFRKYFDIVPFSKVEFYRLLCSDACSLCARTIHAEVLIACAMSN